MKQSHITVKQIRAVLGEKSIRHREIAFSLSLIEQNSRDLVRALMRGDHNRALLHSECIINEASEIDLRIKQLAELDPRNRF